MKAKDLAKILLENPDFEVEISMSKEEKPTKQQIIESYAHDYKYLHNGEEAKILLTDFLIQIEALDKPVCLECGNTIKYGTICKCRFSNPIEDTNKTSLEVPEKIREQSLIESESDWYLGTKINELINYLTLISLNKK